MTLTYLNVTLTHLDVLDRPDFPVRYTHDADGRDDEQVERCGPHDSPGTQVSGVEIVSWNEMKNRYVKLNIMFILNFIKLKQMVLKITEKLKRKKEANHYVNFRV